MGKKGPYGRSSKKPTVGRDDDLPWVAETTYSRFFSPPPRARMTSALERGRTRCHKMRILAHALLVVQQAKY